MAACLGYDRYGKQNDLQKKFKDRDYYQQQQCEYSRAQTNFEILIRVELVREDAKRGSDI